MKVELKHNENNSISIMVDNVKISGITKELIEDYNNLHFKDIKKAIKQLVNILVRNYYIEHNSSSVALSSLDQALNEELFKEFT